MLKEHKEGLIICSACLAGEISKLIMDNKNVEATNVALKYKEEFGDDYYIEIQSHNDKDQIEVNKKLVQIAAENKIEVVVTCDAHYTWEKDRAYQNIYAFNGKYKENGESYIDCFVQSEQEVRDRLKYLPDEIVEKSIRNTHIIADKCNVELPLSAPIMPKVETPIEFKDNVSWLRSICEQGCRSKLGFDINTLENAGESSIPSEKRQSYQDRYEYEIDALSRMGFVDYTLLVYSYANVGKRRGKGRGSGGGSIVNYFANITDVDPIEHGLFFERYVDVSALGALERGEITAKELKIPDVDLDFSGEDCEKVLLWLKDRYGVDRVASIGKFGTNKTKGCIRDICKNMGIDLNTADMIAKSFGEYQIDDLDAIVSAGEKVPEGLKEAYDFTQKYPKLFDYVRKLVGLPKSFGLHACFDKDSIVYTKTGYKKISEVKVGEKVYTHNNEYKTVVNVLTKDVNSKATVITSGAFPIKTTPDHKFYAMQRVPKEAYKPKEYSEPKWIEARELKKADLICMPVHTKEVFPYYLPYVLDLSNEDIWWIFGRFVGDGWCEYIESRKEKRLIICCSKTTTKDLEEIIKHLEKADIKYRYEECSTTYKIHVLNEEMFNFCWRFGKYAHRKRIPSEVIDLPVALLKHFLEGYLSADGYLSKDNRYNFKTVSFELANGLMQIITKCYHVPCSVYTLPAKQEYIEGRLVNSKEKYVCGFKKELKPKDRSIYKDGKLWIYVRDVQIFDEEDQFYDLTVMDDHSYTVNNVAVHNCGKVIATQELDNYLPSCYDDNGVRYLQGDMHDVEDVGLVKVDVLGLRTLDHEYDALELSGNGEEYINPKQKYDDDAVWELFRRGDTSGIFQFSSKGMKETLRKMEVSSIHELAVANALFRPGAMAHIDEYCNRKKGIEEVAYYHSDLEPILKDTYGVIVFQEQLILIARLAKMHNPDILRKLVGKKSAALIPVVKPELHDGLIARGWSEEQFNQLWDVILASTMYLFNRSHAVAYAILAYMTAKIKAHYPAEFYAGLLSSYIGSGNFKDDSPEYFGDIARHKISYIPFSFRNDHRKCSVRDGKIIYALPLVRDMNTETAEILYKNKDFKGNYFYELLQRLYEDGLRKATLSALISLDMFSEFGNSRQLQMILDAWEFAKWGAKDKMLKKTASKNPSLDAIISNHSTDLNAKGVETASYMDIKWQDVMREFEKRVKDSDISDVNIKVKVVNQKEKIGLAPFPTGREEDRSLLFVTDVKPLCNRTTGSQFGWSVFTSSFGSGIQSRFSVKGKQYREWDTNPIAPNDIIRCLGWENDRGYFNLTAWKQVYA